MKEGLRLKGYNYRFINKRIPRLKELLYSWQNGFCFYCDVKLLPLSAKFRSPVPTNYPTLDHLRPRYGKEYQRDNRMNNLVMSCFKCNQQKGNINWTQFYMLKNPL